MSTMSEAIDASDWRTVQEHLQQQEAQRDSVAEAARELQRLAKRAVFALHRGDKDSATQSLADAGAVLERALPILQAQPLLRPFTIAHAMEEYVSACALRAYLKEGRLLRSPEVPHASLDEFLSGVLDFTVELQRHAVVRATQRDVQAVRRCRDLVEAIMGQFLLFDLRNSTLRKKYDGLKYTLKKVENTLYELSLADALTQPAAEQDHPT